MARGDSEETQGEVYPCGNIARVHTWPRAAAAATDPPTPTGDEKGRESERRAKNRCGASVVALEREGR